MTRTGWPTTAQALAAYVDDVTDQFLHRGYRFDKVELNVGRPMHASVVLAVPGATGRPHSAITVTLRWQQGHGWTRVESDGRQTAAVPGWAAPDVVAQRLLDIPTPRAAAG